jgi:signal transduction histidine kinase
MGVVGDASEFDIEPTLTKAQEQEKFGIVGMWERALQLSGSLHVQSSPDSGTEMIADIPYRRADK